MEWTFIAPVALGAIGLAWLIRRRPTLELKTVGPLEAWVIPDSWRLSTSFVDNKMWILRRNDGLTGLKGNAMFATHIAITIQFREPDATGLPSTADTDDLNLVEEAIQTQLCAGNESVLAGVITFSGARKFALYTSNEATARERLTAIKATFSQCEIEVTLHPDPEWTRFDALGTAPQ